VYEVRPFAHEAMPGLASAMTGYRVTLPGIVYDEKGIAKVTSCDHFLDWFWGNLNLEVESRENLPVNCSNSLGRICCTQYAGKILNAG
jgi:hypothetical protein